MKSTPTATPAYPAHCPEGLLHVGRYVEAILVACFLLVPPLSLQSALLPSLLLLDTLLFLTLLLLPLVAPMNFSLHQLLLSYACGDCQRP